jgi:hypothetical protein
MEVGQTRTTDHGPRSPIEASVQAGNDSLLDASMQASIPVRDPIDASIAPALLSQDATTQDNVARQSNPDTEASAAVAAGCQPEEELCNGKDDDCDDDIDEVDPIPCPGGGFKYCVDGRYSDCPQRCEVCMPGSERVCFVNYCTFWGVQTCAADGRSWSRCREQRAPSSCIDIATEQQNSPELQRCCMDNDYCCVDSHDLDGDDDREEMIGRCDQASCDL